MASEDEFQDTVEESGPASSLDVRELVLYGLFRNKLLILFFAGLGAMGGLAYGISKPNTYTSTAKFLFRPGAREQTTPEASVDSDLASRTTVGIGDEIELFSDPSVYESVARQVGIAEVLKPYDPPVAEGQPFPSRQLRQLQSWWFKRNAPPGLPEYAESSPAAVRGATMVLMGNTTIYNPYGTHVIGFACSAYEPELAQKIAATFVEVCQARHSEVYTKENSITFIQDQLALAMNNAKNAAEEYSNHREACGFYNLEEQRTSLVAELRSLDTQSTEDSIRLRQLNVLLEGVRASLEVVPERIEEVTLPPPIPNPKYVALQTQLLGLNERLASLGDTFKPGSATYLLQEELLLEKVANTEKELANTPHSVETGQPSIETSPNPDYDDLVEQQSDFEKERVGLLASLEERKEARHEVKSQLEALLKCEPIHNLLLKEVSSTSSQYDDLVKAQDQGMVLDLIDRDEKMSNLVPIQAATLPTHKDGPQRGKFLSMGLAGGLFAGIALALARQVLDSRLRYPGSVEKALGVRVLGVIPEERTWRTLSGQLRTGA